MSALGSFIAQANGGCFFLCNKIVFPVYADGMKRQFGKMCETTGYYFQSWTKIAVKTLHSDLLSNN